MVNAWNIILSWTSRGIYWAFRSFLSAPPPPPLRFIFSPAYKVEAGRAKSCPTWQRGRGVAGGLEWYYSIRFLFSLYLTQILTLTIQGEVDSVPTRTCWVPSTLLSGPPSSPKQASLLASPAHTMPCLIRSGDPPAAVKVTSQVACVWISTSTFCNF